MYYCEKNLGSGICHLGSGEKNVQKFSVVGKIWGKPTECDTNKMTELLCFNLSLQLIRFRKLQDRNLWQAGFRESCTT